MGGYQLSYVGLAVRDVGRVAEILEGDLGLARSEIGGVPFIGIGEAALALFEVGDPFLGEGGRAGVNHIALSVRDGAPMGEEGPGLAGATEWRAHRSETAGVATRFTTPLDLPVSVSPKVSRLDHIGVASVDNALGKSVFVDRLGCPLESEQTDMETMMPVESFTSDRYGVVLHARDPVPVGGLRVAFVTVGDCELEFLADFDPSHGEDLRHGTAGTTRQDQSAIARYVARHGPGLHHLAFRTDDIDANLAALHEAGHRMINTGGRPGSRRSRIAFMHPASLGGVLMHFVER